MFGRTSRHNRVSWGDVVTTDDLPDSTMQLSKNKNVEGLWVWWRCTGSNRGPPACKAGALPTELHPPERLVGTPGLEPGTSALSGLRSNQLSYAPPCGRKTFTPQQCSDSFAMLNHGRDVTEALTHFRSTSKEFITSLRKDGISSVERR